MSLCNDYKYRKNMESSTTVYEDLIILMNSARSLATDCGERILHSSAITHIVNGTKPSGKDRWVCADEYEARAIRDLFCNISDKEVCDAVYDSFYENKRINSRSCGGKNLIFVYNHITDPNKQARVRILTRMLWYKLIQ